MKCRPIANYFLLFFCSCWCDLFSLLLLEPHSREKWLQTSYSTCLLIVARSCKPTKKNAPITLPLPRMSMMSTITQSSTMTTMLHIHPMCSGVRRVSTKSTLQLTFSAVVLYKHSTHRYVSHLHNHYSCTSIPHIETHPFICTYMHLYQRVPKYTYIPISL